MTRADLTEKLLDIKREKGWTWKYICEQIGGMSPILVTGAILGQMKLTKPQAANAAKLFGLSKSEQTLLNEVPHRGSHCQLVTERAQAGDDTDRYVGKVRLVTKCLARLRVREVYLHERQADSEQSVAQSDTGVRERARVEYQKRDAGA